MPSLYGSAGGANRKLRELYARDSGGTTRKLRELWARDSGGVNRKIFGGLPRATVAVTAASSDDSYSWRTSGSRELKLYSTISGGYIRSYFNITYTFDPYFYFTSDRYIGPRLFVSLERLNSETPGGSSTTVDITATAYRLDGYEEQLSSSVDMPESSQYDGMGASAEIKYFNGGHLTSLILSIHPYSVKAIHVSTLITSSYYSASSNEYSLSDLGIQDRNYLGDF